MNQGNLNNWIYSLGISAPQVCFLTTIYNVISRKQCNCEQYTGSNYSDLAWGIDQGTFGFDVVRESPVGNDAITSVEIAEGYLVKFCEHSGGRGVCQTYSESTPQLERALNNRASHIEVTFRSQLSVAGNYTRFPVTNNWHRVTLVDNAQGIWWTNQAGIRCKLSWSRGVLIADATCPYGEREIDVVVNRIGRVGAIRIRNETYTRTGG